MSCSNEFYCPSLFEHVTLATSSYPLTHKIILNSHSSETVSTSVHLLNLNATNNYLGTTHEKDADKHQKLTFMSVTTPTDSRLCAMPNIVKLLTCFLVPQSNCFNGVVF